MAGFFEHGRWQHRQDLTGATRAAHGTAARRVRRRPPRRHARGPDRRDATLIRLLDSTRKRSRCPAPCATRASPSRRRCGRRGPADRPIFSELVAARRQPRLDRGSLRVGCRLLFKPGPRRATSRQDHRALRQLNDLRKDPQNSTTCCQAATAWEFFEEQHKQFLANLVKDKQGLSGGEEYRCPPRNGGPLNSGTSASRRPAAAKPAVQQDRARARRGQWTACAVAARDGR
jgi:hypothetical protein